MTSRSDSLTHLDGVSSMATRHVLSALAERAQLDGIAEITFAAGGGVEVAEQVRGGAPVDVVVLAQAAMQKLLDEGHLVPGTLVPLFGSSTVLAVPQASPASAPQDEDGFRELLLASHHIGYSTGPSGTALLAVLDDLGLRGELEDRLVQARPGNPVAGMVADGTVDLGVQQLSEMVGTPGIRILGPLPGPLAIESTFSAAVATRSTHPDEAATLVAYLGAPRHAALVEDHGLQLAGAHHDATNADQHTAEREDA